jgi:hypothetical protein
MILRPLRAQPKHEQIAKNEIILHLAAVICLQWAKFVPSWTMESCCCWEKAVAGVAPKAKSRDKLL